MSRTKILVGSFALLLCANQNLLAQDKTTPEAAAMPGQTPATKFVLHAAKPPYAALKHRMLPKYLEQTSGNAAPQYMRAALAWEGTAGNQEAKLKIGDWNELPLAELKTNAEANTFFNSRSTGHWDLIRLASLKEQCDWELPLRQNSISTLIPELQTMRDLAQLVAFKARVEMARGQLDQALETLKTGFALARHAGNGPTLVNGLVGIALTHVMFKQVETLVQQPNCPNLYWTLTTLPSPLIDLRTALEMEQDSVYLAFPELREVRTASHTPAEWDALLFNLSKRFMTLVPEVTGKVDDKSDPGWWAAASLIAATAYPKAKGQLLDAGYTQNKIDAMPPSRAILLAIVEKYDKQRDEVFKWYYLPPAQAPTKAIDEARKAIDKSLLERDTEIIPLAKLLLPALNGIIVAQVRLQREVAALTVVEAIRLYVADHQNKLPARLSDIEVQLPLDPQTGKAFEYSVSGNIATLQSPPPLNHPQALALKWQLEMAAGK